jgi:hypothetical protein
LANLLVRELSNLVTTIRPTGEIEAEMLTEGQDEEHAGNPLDRLHRGKKS